LLQNKDVGERIENMMGSYWELERNIVGNRENPPKKSSSQPPAPLPNLMGKEARHLDCRLGLAIGSMKFLFPNEFITQFGVLPSLSAELSDISFDPSSSETNPSQ
jgi:hypothetical protein